MRMRQKFIVWLWVIAITLSGMFPPWLGVYENGAFPAGYYLIFSPPHKPIHIDQYRLAVEWITITAIGGGLYLTSRRSRASQI